MQSLKCWYKKFSPCCTLLSVVMEIRHDVETKIMFVPGCKEATVSAVKLWILTCGVCGDRLTFGARLEWSFKICNVISRTQTLPLVVPGEDEDKRLLCQGSYKFAVYKISAEKLKVFQTVLLFNPVQCWSQHHRTNCRQIPLISSCIHTYHIRWR